MIVASHISNPNPEEEKLLANLEFSPTSPGPILKDFELLLETVGKHGLPVSATELRLKPQTVLDLNERLSRPQHSQFKRIQQKSYPYVHGLYLIWRCSGLCKVVQDGAKSKLHLNPEGMAVWDALSDADQYFHLLYTWLFLAEEEAVMTDRPRGFFTNLYFCHAFVRDFNGEVLVVGRRKNYDDRIRYYPRLANLAMMDLFGMVDLDVDLSAKDWSVKSVTRKPWTSALLNILAQVQQAYMDSDDWFTEDVNVPSRENTRDLVQLFIPGVKHVFELPEKSFASDRHIFKVALRDKIWRRIAVSGKSMLDELAYGILRAFEFEDRAHLYRFSYKDVYAQEHHIDHEYSDAARFTNEVHVGDLSIDIGARLKFIFDFGDWWEFELTLESREPAASPSEKAERLESYGDAPPQYYWEDEE